MNLLQKLTISIIISFTITLLSFQNKKELLQSIQDKFKNSSEIYFEFTSDKMSGQIYLKKGNQYKIILEDRKIISDGKTIWNQSFIDKQVLISNFRKINSASIENLFFDILSKSKVKKASSKRNSHGQKMTVLEIYNKAYNQEIHLMLDKNNEINSVEINSQLWRISNLKYSLPQPTTFDFVPDSSLELIDLR